MGACLLPIAYLREAEAKFNLLPVFLKIEALAVEILVQPFALPFVLPFIFISISIFVFIRISL